MQVWQHLDKTDHLLRRAEGMIDSARGSKASSAASNGYRPNMQDANKLVLQDGIQGTPGLSDMSFMSED